MFVLFACRSTCLRAECACACLLVEGKLIWSGARWLCFWSCVEETVEALRLWFLIEMHCMTDNGPCMRQV